MDLFIYVTGRLPCALDELEDALDQALGDLGEVSGSGTGQSGSNIDIWIKNDKEDVQKIITIIKTTLRPFGLPASSKIVIGESAFKIG